MRYHFAGWSPGTTIEQNHCLALASTILHRRLSSNMAAVGGQFTEFYGLFLFVQWHTEQWSLGHALSRTLEGNWKTRNGRQNVFRFFGIGRQNHKYNAVASVGPLK